MAETTEDLGAESPPAGTSGPAGVDDVVAALTADPAPLQDVARRAAGRADCHLTQWSVAQMVGGQGGNPTSGGVFRVTGFVSGDGPDGDLTPWSAVLKIVQSLSTDDGSWWEPPDSPFYWRREVEVDRAGLLAGSRGLRTPVVYGIVEPSPVTAWIWLEDLGRMDRSVWGAAEYELAAQALGRFQSRYLTGTPVPARSWLSTDFLRRFHAESMRYVEEVLTLIRGPADPTGRLDPDRGDPALRRLLRFLVEPEPVFAALDAAPRTLCHHDANIDNIVVRPARASGEGPEVVVLDWQSAGPGPVGTDLAQLLCDVPERGTPPRAEVEGLAVRAYHQELVTAGTAVDLDTVRLAYAGDQVLRLTGWTFYLLHESLATAGDDLAAARLVTECADGLASGHLPGLADELAGRIAGGGLGSRRRPQ